MLPHPIRGAPTQVARHRFRMPTNSAHNSRPKKGPPVLGGRGL